MNQESQEADRRIVDELPGMTAVDADHLRREAVEKEKAERESSVFSQMEMNIKVAASLHQRSTSAMVLHNEDGMPREYEHKVLPIIYVYVAGNILLAGIAVGLYWLFDSSNAAAGGVGIIAILFNAIFTGTLINNDVGQAFIAPIGLGKRVWDHCRARGFKTKIVGGGRPSIRVSW